MLCLHSCELEIRGLSCDIAWKEPSKADKSFFSVMFGLLLIVYLDTGSYLVLEEQLVMKGVSSLVDFPDEH